METGGMFLDCPAYLDKHGAVRCGLPAEVKDRYLVSSTGGPLECAKIRCPRGHWFNGPVETITREITTARPCPAPQAPTGTMRLRGR